MIGHLMKKIVNKLVLSLKNTLTIWSETPGGAGYSHTWAW